MILIPEIVLSIIIYLSLLMTGAGAVVLLVLLVRDWKKKQLW